MIDRMRHHLGVLERRLTEPRDAAGLAAFRILFGALMLLSTVRFLQEGWVAEFYERPSFFFKYWGAEWVVPWPAWGMTAHFVILAVLAAMVALGLFYRVAIVGFFLAFTWAELIDVTNYLNHYYLVSLRSRCCAVSSR